MALHVMDEAGRILFENNPLTTVCSLVCNHENQFEYNKAPVEITDEGVIISISQGPQNRIVSTTTGLEANNRGLLVADETGHTTRPGIFASGDVVNGARTVVEAVAHSKVVAESMHQYMQSLVSGIWYLISYDIKQERCSTDSNSSVLQRSCFLKGKAFYFLFITVQASISCHAVPYPIY